MESSHNQSLKIQQRLFIKKQIASLSLDDKNQKSQAIVRKLQSELSLARGKWGAYDALPTEPQINWLHVNPLIEWCHVVVEQDHLFFVNRETNKTYKAAALDGICVPALGFNTNGARLGRGGGFYDRELKNYNNIKLGIAYDLAVGDQIPFESHDIKVNKIVTELRIIDVAA